MQIHELNTLGVKPGETDFLAIDTGFDTAKISAKHFVLQPLDEHNSPTYGNNGQLLKSKGDGGTEWVNEGLPTDAQTAQAVSDWLDAHPEATTTVLDGSLTEAKFSNDLKRKALNDYVTPEMYGAAADGITDDTQAFVDCVATGLPINGLGKTYKISAFNVDDTIIYNCNFIVDSQASGTNIINIATGKSFYVRDCSFESTNDVYIDDSYIKGYTSNIIFIYASYGANIIHIENCKFKNSYTDLLVQGTTNNRTQRIVFKDCVSTDALLSIDVGWCSDIEISECSFTQNSSALDLSHVIYIGYGDSNKTYINDCKINAYARAVIHCYHGTGYETYINNCLIHSTGDRPVLAGNDANSIMYVKGSIIEFLENIYTANYDGTYIFDSCTIKTTKDAANSGLLLQNNPKAIGKFSDCDIVVTGGRFSNDPINCYNCKINIKKANTSTVLEVEDTVLYGCYLKYNNSGDNPLRPKGATRFINSIFENSEITQFAWWDSGSNNIIKNNVFINIPESKYGSVPTTGNIFV